jgi:DNA-binding NarL/FixJ family response regulator
VTRARPAVQRSVDALRSEPESGRVLRLAVRRRELSPRELRVLGLVAQGLSIEEIAQQITIAEETFVAVATAESSLRCVLSKLRARTPAHAVAIGAQRGLIHLDGTS